MWLPVRVAGDPESVVKRVRFIATLSPSFAPACPSIHSVSVCFATSAMDSLGQARERVVDLAELAAHISEIAQDQFGSRPGLWTKA